MKIQPKLISTHRCNVFAAVNSGAWFVQEVSQSFPSGRLPWVTGVWLSLLMIQLISVVLRRPNSVDSDE